MRFLLPVAAVAAAALAVAACDKPGTQSAYNNSGASATPAIPAEQLAATPAPVQPSQAPAVSDTTSPSTAPPQGDATAQPPAPAK